MRTLLVVDNPDLWPLEIPGAEVVPARVYLADPEYSGLRGAVVFNLCRSYAYQRTGYYVSLLAEARGHRPQPSVRTLQDLNHRGVTRIASEDLSKLIQRHLGRLKSPTFVLSIYFGRPLTASHTPLARALYDQFTVPLLRAHFAQGRNGAWELRNLTPIASADIPVHHRDFAVQAATEFFASRPRSRSRPRPPRFHLALLVDPEEEDPPSDEAALAKFERAARSLQIATKRVTRHDYGRLAEFDGLFVRTTTAVNHYTYRFARRAAAEGLVVIDDPLSIIRCTNKVYLKELMERHRILQPRSVLMHRDGNPDDLDVLGYPCVLKVPDSSFSRGVEKVEAKEDADAALARLFQTSSIVLAQEYLPTDYDWRVGVLDGKPLYVCRYFMAKGHWQIMKHESARPTRYGKVETLAVEEAPAAIVRLALRAANAIGNGLYGVDVKESGRRRTVIEVNDNPSLETGMEDRVLGNELYLRVMEVFLQRMEAKRAAGGHVA